MTKEEYEEKVALAASWMQAYYAYDEPLASDEEYDRLIRQLREYEAVNGMHPNSPNARIGVVQKGFTKLNHRAKMWSMEDVFNDDELKAWLKRCKNEGPYFIEPKFDGASLNLYYENGQLVSAATRGDGSVGEDVSLNARSIKGVLAKIDYKKPIEIRGEVLMLKKDFENLNKQRKAANLSLFANPRNAASGSLRQLDTKITKERKLIFYPWGVGENELLMKSHHEVMEFVAKLGFFRDDFVHLEKDISGIKKAFLNLGELRDKKPMMLDGMVIRLDDLPACKALGYTVKYPRFMAAYKFKAAEITTKIKDISLQIGRSGVVTPVAIMDEVELAGVRVNRASLHNFAEILRLDLRLNDSVCLIRSADVIPKITKVYKDRRDGSEVEVKPPKNCPSCGSLLANEDPLIYCKNPQCVGVKIEKLKYFVSKKCLNIDGLGKNIIEFLFQKEVIKEAKDIFFLKAADFENLEGFKEKKIGNILASIKAAKSCKLHAFINALGIPLIGEVAARQLALNFGKAWYKQEDYEALEGFGVEMAKEVAKYGKENALKIEEFYTILDIQNETLQKDGKLSGLSFVLTGTLSKPREEIKEIILSNGGKVLGQLSQKIDYLLCGQKSGSKLIKAQKLGIKILDEEGFKKLYEA